MKYSHAQLRREASRCDFRIDVFEKVLYLITVLQEINRHPELAGNVALKGGTALNLFTYDIPRLSADIDLNYVGSPNLQVMQAARPRVEAALAAVSLREGLSVRHVPSDHAGGKWRLTYHSVFGNPGTLALDVNFLLRVPLWQPQLAESRALVRL